MDSEHPEIEREFDLTEVERRLAAWRPATGALNRDRLLYDAGRAAARADGQSGSWRPATVALALVAALLGGLLANERSRCLKLETSLASTSRNQAAAATRRDRVAGSGHGPGDRAVRAQQLLCPLAAVLTKNRGHFSTRRRI